MICAWYAVVLVSAGAILHVLLDLPLMDVWAEALRRPCLICLTKENIQYIATENGPVGGIVTGPEAAICQHTPASVDPDLFPAGPLCAACLSSYKIAAALGS
jgi:hypothetical protein